MFSLAIRTTTEEMREAGSRSLLPQSKEDIIVYSVLLLTDVVAVWIEHTWQTPGVKRTLAFERTWVRLIFLSYRHHPDSVCGIPQPFNTTGLYSLALLLLNFFKGGWGTVFSALPKPIVENYSSKYMVRLWGNFTDAISRSRRVPPKTNLDPFTLLFIWCICRPYNV